MDDASRRTPRHFPMACWRHHPIADRNGDALAAATLAMQARHKFDLVKISPPGTYQAMDLGGIDAYCGHRLGNGAVPHHILQREADWTRLAETAVPGHYARETMRAVRIVRERLAVPRPIIPTLFSPIAIAEQLAGGQALRTMLHRQPAVAHRLLDRLADYVIDTIAAARKAGASGVFYVVQQMRREAFDAPAYAPLYHAYDARCIAAAAKLPMSILHLHGVGIHLPPARLPPDIWLHCEYEPGNPSLRRLRSLEVPLVLGIPVRQMATLAQAGAIGPFLADLTAQIGDHPAMLAPACTLPLDFCPSVIDRWQAEARGEAPAPFPIAALPAGDAVPAATPGLARRDIVTRALRDVVSVPGSPRRRLALLQRLEQDLHGALPLDCIVHGGDDPAAWIDALALVPDRPLPTATAARRAGVLLDPGASAFDAMGLVRVLRDRLDTRLIELDPALWLAPRDIAWAAARAAVLAQVMANGSPAVLIGYGRMAPVAAWIADMIETQGAQRPRVMALQVEAPALRTAHWRRLLRVPWTMLVELGLLVDRTAWISAVTGIGGRLAGWRTTSRLRGTAADSAMWRRLARLPAPAGVICYPATGRIARAALYDPATLTALVRAIDA